MVDPSTGTRQGSTEEQNVVLSINMIGKLFIDLFLAIITPAWKIVARGGRPRPACPGGALFGNQKARLLPRFIAPARLVRAERCLTTRPPRPFSFRPRPACPGGAPV